MKWNDLSAWLEERRDLWLDLLRIYLGIGLFIRGLIFFSDGGEVMLHQVIGEGASEWFLSAVVLHYVAAAHLAGGILLAVGLLTRVAAIAQIPVLIGAIVVHAPDGMFSLGQSLEFAAFVLVTLIIITIAGPGRLSVDYYTFGSARHRHDTHVHPAGIGGSPTPGH